MQVASVIEGTDFRASFDRLVREGKVKGSLDQAYFNSLKKSVLYWDGEKFVNTPTMNRLYAGSKMLP